MKRSEMVKEIAMLLGTMNTANVSDKILKAEADWLLMMIEKQGMLPPGYMKPIPVEEDGKQYPLIPGDFKYNGVWCTPGVNEWEPEQSEKPEE